MATQLRLSLKPQVKSGSVSQGVDFLGYCVFPTHLTVRRRVLAHARERLAQLEAHMQPHVLRATVASYWGHLAHAKAHRARAALLVRFPWLKLWFQSPERENPHWRKPPKGAMQLSQQLNWFARQFPQARIHVQQGLGRVCVQPSLNRSTRQTEPPVLEVWVREANRMASGLKERVVVGGRCLLHGKEFSIFSRSWT